MKRKTSILLLALAFMFSAFLTACGGSSNQQTSTGSNEPNEEADSTNGAKEKYVINIAYGNQPGEPVDQIANKWKELAEEKSEGRLELKLFPSSQLGAEKDVIEQAVLGNNALVLTAYDFLMEYIPDLGILAAPYLTEDFDDLFYLTTTDWFKELEAELEGKGIDIVTTNTIYGKRHLMTTKEVKTPEDLQGLKIRVPNNNMYIKTFEALGATPTPLPLPELYTALQQNLVDGAENPLPVLQGSKTNEVAKYLALTEHNKIISPWIAGTKFLETIPEDLVQILKETGDEAGEYGKAIIEEESEKVLEDFKNEGVIINEVDLDPFKERAQHVYTAFPNWTPGLYETVQELLQSK